MAEFLNFKEISQVKFLEVLNWLNIPYERKNGEMKTKIDGRLFVFNVEKNLFFCPDDETIKGSVINFVSEFRGLDLRSSAQEIKDKFLAEPKVTKRDMPELDLHYTETLNNLGISRELAKEYEVGLVKQKSIISGKIALKYYDDQGNHSGYIGWGLKDKKWFFPKNFKRTLYNAHRVIDEKTVMITVNPFHCLYLIGIGFKNCVSLVGKSMTDTQEQTLKRFSTCIIFHDEPDNILIRLKHECFVKAPSIIKPLNKHSVEEIVQFLC